MSVETLETAGTVCMRTVSRTKGASEVRVSIADAGNGAAVDVRRWITTPPLELVGRNGKHRSDYVGPTREGLWLQPSEARELAELLEIAATAAEREQEREYGEATA
jgi:hypothetical protein